MNKYNAILLADISNAMQFRLGILCDCNARREVAMLLVDSIAGDEDPWEVTERSGNVFSTDKWDGYDVEISQSKSLNWMIDMFFNTPTERILAGHAELDSAAMSTIINQVLDELPLGNERHLKSIVREIKSYMSYRSDTRIDVVEWNDFVANTGGGDTIYFSLEELARCYYADNVEELVRAMFFGDIQGWNDYVYINGYGNICSISDLGAHILYDALAEWLYSQGRVTIKVEVYVEHGDESWDVEFTDTDVSLDVITDKVTEELSHEIEMGYVKNDPKTWKISLTTEKIE